VPLLLLILFMFLGLPAVGVTVSSFWALVLGLTLYNGAVLGEIFRAGIRSLPKGQTEAAYAIGLRRGQALRLVLLPQAVRLMLPALVSQLVTLLKDTSLGFVIGYAVVYIAVNGSLSFLARWLDRRTRNRRRGRLSHATLRSSPGTWRIPILGEDGRFLGRTSGFAMFASLSSGYSALTRLSASCLQPPVVRQPLQGSVAAGRAAPARRYRHTCTSTHSLGRPTEWDCIGSCPLPGRHTHRV